MELCCWASVNASWDHRGKIVVKLVLLRPLLIYRSRLFLVMSRDYAGEESGRASMPMRGKTDVEFDSHLTQENSSRMLRLI